MKNKIICLNCGTETIGKYCHNCKQISEIKRLEIKHFIKHDILHGIMHVDKGLFFTLKEIIMRPGKVACNYIKGKRVIYYNFFYLSLILIGLILFVSNFKSIPANYGENDLKVDNLILKYLKYILLSFIPLFTLSSLFAYRKVRMNIVEHSIVAGISLIYALCFNLLKHMLYLIIPYSHYSFYDFTFLLLTSIITITIYYQAFREYYSTKKHLNLLNAVLTVVFFYIMAFVFLAAFIILMMIK